MSTLPPKVAYKWQSGEEEQFKKVTMDELEDADEANEHMQQMVDESGLQNQKKAAHAEELSEDEGPESPLWVAEAAADADGVSVQTQIWILTQMIALPALHLKLDPQPQ